MIFSFFSLWLTSLCMIVSRSILIGSDGKESACNAGDPGSIPGLGRSPGEGNGNPLQYSCLKNSVDRGYSQWGHKELDMTEQLTLSQAHPHLHKWPNFIPFYGQTSAIFNLRHCVETSLLNAFWLFIFLPLKCGLLCIRELFLVCLCIITSRVPGIYLLKNKISKTELRWMASLVDWVNTFLMYKYHLFSFVQLCNISVTKT